jgi:hypothetical protein
VRNGLWRRRAGARLAVAAVLTVVLGACKVDMTVTVASDALGAGRVTVQAVFDKEAAVAFASERSAAGTDTGRIDLRDLRTAGWETAGWKRRGDGSAQLVLSHRFTTVAEANDVLAQLSSADGPFGQLQLIRNRSPIATTITLRGPGDFSKGLASFGDAQIAAVTGGGALGVSDAEIARQSDVATTAAVLNVKLVADLVGTQASWELPVGKATPIEASGQQRSWATIGGFLAALGALAVFVALGRGRRQPNVAAVSDAAVAGLGTTELVDAGRVDAERTNSDPANAQPTAAMLTDAELSDTVHGEEAP